MMEVVVGSDPGSRPHKPTPQKVSVYFRKSDKSGVKVHIPQFIMLWELQHIISRELSLASHRQILFICGKKFHQSPNQLLEIKENTIIHVHEKQTWEYRVIGIKVQILEAENLLREPKEYTVMRRDTILRFLQEKLSISTALVVQSGRKIDINRTFAEQEILEGTSITVKI